MEFLDTPQQAEFRQQARSWINNHAPHYLTKELNRMGFAGRRFKSYDFIAEARDWQKKKATAGWAALSWPTEYGGRNASQIEQAIWRQEEGLFSKLSSLFTIGMGMCAPTLISYASESDKQRYLPLLASGEEIWCQLFSEPRAGSDLAGIHTRAVKDGDEWVVNGHKIWTSGAQYSDFGILLTRSDPSVPKHKGLTYFFLDMKSPGIEIEPIKQMSGGTDFCEVHLTDVRIPDSQRLGDIGKGWSVALTTLMNERLSIGAKMPTGFDELFQLMQLLEQYGQVSDQQRVKLAEQFVVDSGLQYTSARILSALSQGQTPGSEASIGKLVAGKAMQNAMSEALDMIAASGLPPSRFGELQERIEAMFFRSAATRVEGGTDEILRNIIAERVLGLPPEIRMDRDKPFKEL